MDHDYITRFNLVDQYVLGKLDPGKVEEFEAHFVDCPECVDELSISRGFVNDLKGLAFQETLLSDQRRPTETKQRWLPQLVPRNWWPLAIAFACLVLAVGIAFFAIRRLNRLEGEARQAREDAAAINQKYQQGLQTATESERQYQLTNQEMAQRLDELEQKLKTDGTAVRQEQSLVRGSVAATVNFPIYPLVALVRGQAPVPVEIALPPSSSGYALSIPVEDPRNFSAYRVTILNDGGAKVFNRGGFKPDAYHALSLSLTSNFLRPGTYDLKVEGLTPPHDWIIVGNYPFRIANRR